MEMGYVNLLDKYCIFSSQTSLKDTYSCLLMKTNMETKQFPSVDADCMDYILEDVDAINATWFREHE